ncbi:TQXA domain-containing protein [Gordonia sp. (in: high G+C Gram-positive bacteria)]|uniref:TQXA domain-containing protein n=1 Tax=Gordonia sp. (in: high G+C Gram-positive bacteria) TaxID=84139 RepID=UPI0039E63AC2
MSETALAPSRAVPSATAPVPVVPADGPAAAPFARLTRYRGGTYPTSITKIHFADGTCGRTDLVRLNPNVGAYSLDFHGRVTDSPTVYRPHSWDQVSGAYAARFRSGAITAVLSQSYPVVGLHELSDRLRAAGHPLGAADLREHQAIAATQAALWRLTNNLVLDTIPVDAPLAVRDVDETDGRLVEVEFAESVVLGGYGVTVRSSVPGDRVAARLLKPTNRGWSTVAGSAFTTRADGRRERTLAEAATVSDSRRGGVLGFDRYRLEVTGAGRIGLDDLSFRVSGAARYVNEAPIVHLYEYLLDRVDVAVDGVEPWVLLADDHQSVGYTPLVTAARRRGRTR